MEATNFAGTTFDFFCLIFKKEQKNPERLGAVLTFLQCRKQVNCMWHRQTVSTK